LKEEKMDFIEVNSICVERNGMIIFSNTIGTDYYVDHIKIANKDTSIYEAIKMIFGKERIVGEYDSTTRIINLYPFGERGVLQ
jgi:hypothetical protein